MMPCFKPRNGFSMLCSRTRLSVVIIGLLCVSSSSLAFFPRCGWYAEVEPFYVTVTDTLLTNSIYAVKVADPTILGDFKKQYFLNLDHDWGARIAFGYDMHCCPNYCDGLSVEYTTFDQTNRASVHNDNRTTAGLPVLAPAEFIDITDESSARFSDASSSLSQKFCTFDLLFHRILAMSHCLTVKTTAGVRYFALKEQLRNHYNFAGFIGPTFVNNIYNVNFKNELHSVGPQIGTKMNFYVANGFGISGELTGSLLYGESFSEFHNTYNLSPGTTPLGPATSLSSFNEHDDTGHVIPAVSAKIALTYQYFLPHCSYVNVELGYRGDRYFNAANDVAFQQLLGGDDFNSKSNYQDFDLTGPFLSVSFHS